jgi:hypothetical protein
MERMTVLERAFQLARSGECRNVTAVRKRLIMEGYANVHSQLSGRGLVNQIHDICKKATARRDA